MTKLNPWYKSPLFFFQVLTHLSLIPMIMYADLSQWGIAVLMYYLFGCWGIAITYHRLLSHKSFESPSWFKYIGMFWGTLCGVGSPIQWVALHRNHHSTSDTDVDPHNPHGSIKNFLKMHFLSMLAPTSARYVPDLLRDKMQQRFHRYYWYVHLVYAISVYFIDPFALIYAYLVPAVMLWHAMSALTTVSHKPFLGYRSHDTNDKSTNVWWVGYLAFGEGWHNNHHHKASDWKFGQKWYEFDLSALIIKLVKK